MNRLNPEIGDWNEYLTSVGCIIQESIIGLDVDGNFGPLTQATVASLLGIQELQMLPMRDDENTISCMTYAKHPDGYTIAYDSKKRVAIVV